MLAVAEWPDNAIRRLIPFFNDGFAWFSRCFRRNTYRQVPPKDPSSIPLILTLPGHTQIHILMVLCQLYPIKTNPWRILVLWSCQEYLEPPLFLYVQISDILRLTSEESNCTFHGFKYQHLALLLRKHVEAHHRWG